MSHFRIEIAGDNEQVQDRACLDNRTQQGCHHTCRRSERQGRLHRCLRGQEPHDCLDGKVYEGGSDNIPSHKSRPGDPSKRGKAGASVIATGSYKFENRANNALVFPFTMRAILDNHIRKVSQQILINVAYALADLIPKDKTSAFNIIPDVTNPRIREVVNSAVRSATTTTTG